jgi:hypothetical protein
VSPMFTNTQPRSSHQVLTNPPGAPIPERVKNAAGCLSTKTFDARHTREYFERGGRAEFALVGLALINQLFSLTLLLCVKTRFN